MQEQMAKYLVEKLEHDKKVKDLTEQNRINQAKMLEEIAKYNKKKEEAMGKLHAKGMLGYQSTNPDDGYNYPIAQTFNKINQ